ncbi:thioredoxin family protein [Mariniblastus fucicola]|uniref:Thiol:disulfide interchange protein n=1 Tax=Mariniblastus fucicola TaxID=980251 RepID=A0A5B9P3T9_9BACT|nr:thioredoxin family protein [Mariniblastus fucicola]QEG20874.1 thiol:disulfide interchange protein precursor [Mariniblastus fucicola]
MKTLLAIGMALAMMTTVAQAQQTQPAAEKSSSKEAMTYSKAYKKAQAGDKPLLVLVTAEWCPPCRQMKANTLPTLFQRDTFHNFHFAMMDYDKESKLADKLIGDRGLPQLIMFEKSNGKWLRRYLTGNKGLHSIAGVESFVAQAGTYRLASNGEEATKKK